MFRNREKSQSDYYNYVFIAVHFFIWRDEIYCLPHLLIDAPGTPINRQETPIEKIPNQLLNLFVHLR
jgi:hypothetical protein